MRKAEPSQTPFTLRPSLLNLLYSAGLTLLFIGLLPYFIFQAARHGKYLASFRERLGRLPDGLGPTDQQTLWVHTVSVGEFNAARPLLAALRRQLPEYRIVVSTVTKTGQTMARAQVGRLIDAAFFFPFDWQFAVRRSLHRIQPVAVLLLETELWPNFLHACRREAIPTIVVNGRISPKSFRGYDRFRFFVSRVISDVSLLIMQTTEDAERARSLGADADKVLVCGNLKYDLTEPVALERFRDDAPSSPATIREPAVSLPRAEPVDVDSTSRPADERPAAVPLRSLLATIPGLLVAGSTAPGEEKLILEALALIRGHEGLGDTRLLVAPRHPERFDEVAELLARSGFTCARRSAMTAASNADVILLDTIGELAASYEYAALAFVGGSLVPRGGHNVIEPALYARPILVGPHTTNFRQIVADFTAARALVQLGNEDSTAPGFAAAAARLLRDPVSAVAMGNRARAILERNRGATDCSVTAILNLLNAARFPSDDRQR